MRDSGSNGCDSGASEDEEEQPAFEGDDVRRGEASEQRSGRRAGELRPFFVPRLAAGAARGDGGGVGSTGHDATETGGDSEGAVDEDAAAETGDAAEAEGAVEDPTEAEQSGEDAGAAAEYAERDTIRAAEKLVGVPASSSAGEEGPERDEDISEMCEGIGVAGIRVDRHFVAGSESDTKGR